MADGKVPVKTLILERSEDSLGYQARFEGDSHTQVRVYALKTGLRSWDFYELDYCSHPFPLEHWPHYTLISTRNTLSRDKAKSTLREILDTKVRASIANNPAFMNVQLEDRTQNS